MGGAEDEAAREHDDLPRDPHGVPGPPERGERRAGPPRGAPGRGPGRRREAHELGPLRAPRAAWARRTPLVEAARRMFCGCEDELIRTSYYFPDPPAPPPPPPPPPPRPPAPGPRPPPPSADGGLLSRASRGSPP